MSETIAQRDLRNDSAEILRRVEAGEEFVVTRNGTPVAFLTSVPHHRAVPAASVMAAFSGAPQIDARRFREEADERVDQALRDPFAQ